MHSEAKMHLLFAHSTRCPCTYSSAARLPGLQADLKAFRGIDIDVCHTLLELLYSNGAAESRGTIERGGSLMAGAAPSWQAVCVCGCKSNRRMPMAAPIAQPMLMN